MTNVEVGKIYGYDIDGLIYSSNPGTYTVKVLDIYTQQSFCGYDNLTKNKKLPLLAKCVSVQTGEEITCNIEHLTSIEVCKNIYYAFLDEGETSDFISEVKITRLERILNQTDNDIDMVDFRPNITEADVIVIKSGIDMALDLNEPELFNGLTNLLKKMEYYICESVNN